VQARPVGQARAEGGNAGGGRRGVGAERVPVELRSSGRQRAGRGGDAVDGERAARDADLQDRLEADEVRRETRGFEAEIAVPESCRR